MIITRWCNHMFDLVKFLPSYKPPKLCDTNNVLIFGLGNFGSFRNFGHFHVIPNLLKPIGNKAPHLQITYHQSFWSFLLVMTQWVLQTVRILWLAMLSKFTNRGKHLYQCLFAERPDYPINPSMPELRHIKGEQY